MQKLKEKKNLKIVSSRIKRRTLKHTMLLRIIIVISFLSLIFWLASFLYSQTRETNVGYYLSLAKNFVLAPNDKIKEDAGKTNILLLGKGGEGHEAPDLTDSVIVIFVDTRKQKVDMISLPRDIWVEDLRTKINSLYYWGNKKDPNGGGILLAKTTIEDIIGEPIHHTAVLDFSGFKEIIDYLGGIEVDVETAFTDEKYPLKGKENAECPENNDLTCRYETISFEEGLQKMDGEKALKFVRSRKAQGDEGTDIARAKRQQKVLEAIKKQVLKKENALSPKKIIKLFELIQKNIETDMTDNQMAIVARYVFNARDNIKRHSIPESLLIVPEYQDKYDNLYVFVPTSGNWESLQKWIDNVL